MLQRIVRKHVKCALALVLATGAVFLGFHDAASAQEGTTSGSVAGTVVGPDGRPQADAVVRVVSQERGAERQVLTDADGRFRVPLLSPGLYTVRAELPPNQPVEVGDVRVTVGERTQVTLELQPVEGRALEVTVGGATQVDVSESGVVSNVSEDQIDNLPSSGRDFTDFINLDGLVSPQPAIGTGGQFSIGGARTSGTNIQIDGADANNAFFGENRGSSRIPFTFSLESIKEFQVVTNGYDVEYGKFSGGVVNAVTKSGSNEFEGGAHFFWRDESLTADNFDGGSPADFQSFQFGGNVSGPIVEDELHFFAAGDFQLRDQPVFALTPERSNIEPGAVDRLQDILVNTYGFDRSEVEDDFGQFEETDDQANLFGRLDWTINRNHRATVRVNYSDFENRNDRISPAGTQARTVGGTFNDESLSLVGELNSLFGSDVYNTLRVQYSNEDRPRPGNSTLPTVSVDMPTRDGGTTSIDYGGAPVGILFDNRLKEEKVQITDNLTFDLGDHTLKVGTDNVLTSTLNRFWLFGNGLYDAGSLDNFEAGNPGFFLRFVPSLEDPETPVAEFDTREWSFYIQDTWQATDRLRLNAGLRYDLTDFDRAAQGLADADVRTSINSLLDDHGALTSGQAPTRVAPDDTDNWGPRLSFTYDVNGDESSVLRGGGGVFYGRIPTVLHSNVLAKTPNPLLTVTCIGSAVPEPFNFGDMEDPENIPSRCEFEGVQFPDGEFGLGIVGAPQVTAWDPDVQQPTTFKANLGYEQQINERWQAGLEVLFSQTHNNFTVQDLNLRDEVFTTADGRPVFTEPGELADNLNARDDFGNPDPDDANNEQRGVDETIDRLFFETDAGKFRAWNVKLDVQGRPFDDFRISANYTYNRAFDNSSFFCCTESEGFAGTPTAGNPNRVGGIGDDRRGAWGPTDFERRHVFVANGILELPADFQVSLIYRAQSGNPFTPSVAGDINADGDDENDRPFLPDPDNLEGAQFGRVADFALVDGSPAEELAQYRELLAENECLQENVGQIIPRNDCRNPWWHQVDIKLKKGFDTFGGQNAEIVLDLFNVLDALDFAAGEFVFKQDEIFRVQGFDEEEQEVIYEVRDDFGREIPVGFEPFQFQAQIGVQYHF